MIPASLRCEPGDNVGQVGHALADRVGAIGALVVVAGAGRGSMQLKATAEAPPWLAVSSITVSVGGGYRASS